MTDEKHPSLFESLATLAVYFADEALDDSGNYPVSVKIEAARAAAELAVAVIEMRRDADQRRAAREMTEIRQALCKHPQGFTILPGGGSICPACGMRHGLKVVADAREEKSGEEKS